MWVWQNSDEPFLSVPIQDQDQTIKVDWWVVAYPALFNHEVDWLFTNILRLIWVAFFLNFVGYSGCMNPTDFMTIDE